MHVSTTYDNNNIKTLITQDHQIRTHPIMHASGTQLQNQQQHVNVSITRCIEDHSPQTKNASKSMDRAKVVDTRGANEDHLHVMQT